MKTREDYERMLDDMSLDRIIMPDLGENEIIGVKVRYRTNGSLDFIKVFFSNGVSYYTDAQEVQEFISRPNIGIERKLSPSGADLIYYYEE